MKKFCFAYLFFLSIPTLGFSSILENLSGDTGIEYLKTETQSTYKTEIDKISEFINLNYRNYIYDGRMLNYYFQLKFSKVDENGMENNKSRETSYQNVEYDVNLNFFQKSFMPFSIKANHTESPTTLINEDSIVETTFNRTNYSLAGRVESSYLNISYNADISESETSSALGEKTLDSNSLYMGFSKEFKDDSKINLGLSHSNSNTQILYGNLLQENRTKNSISTNYSTENLNIDLNYTKKDENDTTIDKIEDYTIDTISSSLRYKFSEELNLDNSFQIENNGKNNSKNNTGNLRLRWTPSKSYDALVSLDTNVYEVEKESYQNYGINLSSNYKINENWSNSQNINFLDVATPASTHKVFLLSTTTNYKKAFSPKLDMYANNNISYIQNDNTSLIEEVELEDNNTVIIDSSVGLNKRFDFLNARNGYDLNFVKSFTSDNTDMEKIKLSSFLYTFPFSGVEYNIEADVSTEKKNNADNKMVTNIKNLFKLTKNIDARGRFVLTAGLTYKVEKDAKFYLKSLEPTFSLAFNYRLWSTLSFKSLYDMMVDERNKTINHSFDSGLYYKFRNFEVDCNTKVIKQIKEEDEDFSSMSVMLTMKRKF